MLDTGVVSPFSDTVGVPLHHVVSTGTVSWMGLILFVLQLAKAIVAIASVAKINCLIVH